MEASKINPYIAENCGISTLTVVFCNIKPQIRNYLILNMKVLARILSLFTLLAVATLYTSCGGNDPDPKSDEEIQLDKLKANQWVIFSADLDGTNRTADFTTTTPMTLTFTGTYSNPGGTYLMQVNGSRPNPNPWPQSSEWKFGANVLTQMIRTDDDLGMNYTLTDTQLTISFTYTGAGFMGGRVEQVEGDWTFVFDKP